MEDTSFDFVLGQRILLSESGERGLIVGRAEYTNSAPSYFVRYRAADGRLVEQWWAEDALTPAN